jgi:hypothetical protein
MNVPLFTVFAPRRNRATVRRWNWRASHALGRDASWQAHVEFERAAAAGAAVALCMAMHFLHELSNASSSVNEGTDASE